MAARFLCAIAAKREMGMVRQRGKKIKRPAVRRRSHLGAVFLHECGPRAFGRGALRQRDQFRTGRKIWKPDVIPVLRSVFSLRDAARRPPNRADSKTLAASPDGAEPDKANRHSTLVPRFRPAGQQIGQGPWPRYL
jgi:hypothetical protein